MDSPPDEPDPNSVSILVVDDEQLALKHLARILRKKGHEVTPCAEAERALALLEDRSFDIVLTDLVLGAHDGLEILARAKEQSPATEVIIITGYASVPSAIEATKLGAFHYLQKPIRPAEVLHVVQQAVTKLSLVGRIRELEGRTASGFPSIVGCSASMVAIKKLIRQIEESDSNVLISGESGTGKELIARAIHATSPRRTQRFLAFNCASFTEELLANELFGHEKDAFTGATSARAGLLESAHRGSVFFDEVGDMSPAMQAKLLRVVQERELIRVGGTQPVPVDIRIIAATNKDLKKLCAGGLFRQDLYFRLNVIPVRLPALSERREDIPLLASHFLDKYRELTVKRITGFSDEVMGLLTSHGYPGNVRELENIIEHACSMARGSQIALEDLPPDLRDYDSFTFNQPARELKTLEQLEEEYIRWVLEKVGNNKTQAAKILGIDRVSLYRKLKRMQFEE